MDFDPTLPVETAFTPPSHWYTSEEFLQKENKTVFRNHWQYVGRLDQVHEPGQFFTGKFFNEPYLVTRNQEGELKAFYNVCSHHGTCVAKGEGKATEFRCPYHGWTYGDKGELKKAPKAGAIKALDRSQLGLKSLPIQSWGPFLFIHFGTPKQDLILSIDHLNKGLKDLNFDKLQFVRRKVYSIQCNWKVFVDNYLDGGYHVPHMHPGLTGQIDFNSYKNKIYPTYSIQTCVGNPEATASDKETKERLGKEAFYAWLHPNFMINRYGPWMDTNWVIPTGPNSCDVVFEYYLDPKFEVEGKTREEFIAESMIASEQVQVEDTEICDMVQVGLLSSAYIRGVYASQYEKPMYEFHKLLDRDFKNQ